MLPSYAGAGSVVGCRYFGSEAGGASEGAVGGLVFSLKVIGLWGSATQVRSGNDRLVRLSVAGLEHDSDNAGVFRWLNITGLVDYMSVV